MTIFAKYNRWNLESNTDFIYENDLEATEEERNLYKEVMLDAGYVIVTEEQVDMINSKQMIWNDEHTAFITPTIYNWQIIDCSDNSELWETDPDLAQVLADQIRMVRKTNCFDVLDRGQEWYSLLDEEEIDLLRQWYLAWLDAPQKLTYPDSRLRANIAIHFGTERNIQ